MEQHHILMEQELKDSFWVSRLEKASPGSDVASRLSYHRILLVQEGRGELVVDGNAFSIKGREVFLLSKGQVYAFDASASITGYTLSFGDCFWERVPSSASNCKAVLFNNASANQRLDLSAPELSDFANLFAMLHDEFERERYNNQMDALAAFLKIIMIKLANVRLTDETTFDSQDYLLYRQFMDLLSAQFKQYHEVGAYAGILGVTSRRLSDVCKRCSHKTAKELITGQIIAEAKRSLQFSSIAVKEIAYQLNFTSPEQFSHFFKKATNVSPAAFRSFFLNSNSG